MKNALKICGVFIGTGMVLYHMLIPLHCPNFIQLRFFLQRPFQKISEVVVVKYKNIDVTHVHLIASKVIHLTNLVVHGDQFLLNFCVIHST